MINIGLNYIIIIVLVIYFFVCIVKKISFKIAFVIGIIYLIIATTLLTLEEQDLAINIVATAYYLLIIAVVLAIVEYYRDNIKPSKYKRQKEMLILKDKGKIKKK